MRFNYKSKYKWNYLEMTNNPKNFVLRNVLVGVKKIAEEEEDDGWQPISAISLQQSLLEWQSWSQ